MAKPTQRLTRSLTQRLVAPPSSLIDLGGATGPKVRLVPDSATSFYLLARSTRGTAFAYRFQRNVGGVASTDSGQSGSQPWRPTSVMEFASTLSDPKGTPLRTWLNDTAAIDYALAFPNGKWGGSYHGAEVVSAESILVDGVAVDPTAGIVTGASFSKSHSSTITAGSDTATITGFSFALDAAGLPTLGIASVTSTAILNQAMLGMMVGTGAFDEGTFLYSGVEYKYPVSTGTQTYGRTYLQQFGTVSMRRTADGNTIRVVSNAPSVGGYRRTSIVRDTTLNRSKYYFDFGGSGSAFGTKSGVTWSLSFDLGAPGTTSFAANLITNGAFGANIANWTTTSGSVAWNASGVMRQTRSASGTDARALQAIATTATVPYLLAAENTYTPLGTTNAGSYVNPGSIALGNASNGSLITPAPAYPKVAFDQNGYNAHVVIPNQATSYPMLILEAQGAANTLVGDTSDFDNVSMFQLAA